MASEVTFKWTGPGLAELNRLDDTMKGRAKNKAARVGAVVYMKKLEAKLPRTTELEDDDDIHLADSLAVKKMTKKQTGGLARFQIGVTGAARKYAHLVEFGSKHMTGNRIWTNTLRREGQDIIDAMGDDLRKVIKRHGRN